MEIQRGGIVSQLLKDVPIPKMFRAEQTFPRPKIAREDIPEVVRKEMSKERVAELIQPGKNIAITAGSRGIANVDVITKAIVDFVKSRGANPFIVPAMGSHGGATAEGQTEILTGYNITEASMGCPVRSCMDAVLLGYSELGKPVYIDRLAYESDGIIVSCHVKPHNAFRGKYESGFCKMMVVGLGKQKGAESVHSDGMGLIAQNLPANAKVILEKAPILMGVGTIENAYDETAKIVAVHADDILDEEPGLLQEAFGNMPKLIVGECDVLVVNEIGKNISGTGVDPNITGTFSTPYASGGVKVQRTCFLDLTEASHGNALGTGLASAITKRLFDKIDLQKMYPNTITNTVIRSAEIPIIMATDKEAIQFCIRTLNNADKDHARVIRIQNSLHIGKIMLSEAYYQDVLAGKYEGLKALDEPQFMKFDQEGNLVTPL
ncbi:nickel-dependent lactate racemase [Acidaminococcus sp. NSJ-142]|uniref:lactate racemase domain-containing protein n=1 Tax=Acidaminococcus hominis TaxID=2897706 RepID=UPI001E52CB0D|nr:lactate racemase domain-containing protein [Acidaminococcus hominis]MCD2435320.1 nickel-dependent lactate racemase [Acidaminococcus hominis]